MKQSKNNSNDNIVSGRLSAGPKPPKSGVAGQSSPPSYGVNRLGIVSNEDAAGSPAQYPVQPPAQTPAQAPAPAPAQVAAPAQAPARQPGLARQQSLPGKPGPAAPEAHLGTAGNARMGVSPVKAAGQAARPGCQTPPIFTHKDVASSAALRPMFAPPQQAPPAGPTLPALSRTYGFPGVPRRDTSRLGNPAREPGRSPVDELWATSDANGVADDAPTGAGNRPKIMLVVGGVILLAAIVWACLPNSVKSAYHPPPQAAQASPTNVQPVRQPEPPPLGTPASPVSAGGTGVSLVSPSVPSPYQQGEESHGHASAMVPEGLGTPDGNAIATATTKPAQDEPTSKPAAVAPPAKALDRQYRPCPPGIKLTGIVQQAGRKVACINGKFRDVGDMIYGARVVEIKDLSVEMEQDGQRFLVGFGSPTDSASDDEAPADEDKSSSQDTPKASKPEPDTQPADTPQPPAKKKHKSKPMDE